ncbi:MAG: hypothetical protein PF518_16305 [Spirochaetaceae bacterium]|jgi:small neutral amino acid transporter SnatA (MarC family)|nr:hypothetical protein [Spirochaetaceae bacterium]
MFRLWVFMIALKFAFPGWKIEIDSERASDGIHVKSISVKAIDPDFMEESK